MSVRVVTIYNFVTNDSTLSPDFTMATVELLQLRSTFIVFDNFRIVFSLWRFCCGFSHFWIFIMRFMTLNLTFFDLVLVFFSGDFLARFHWSFNSLKEKSLVIHQFSQFYIEWRIELIQKFLSLWKHYSIFSWNEPPVVIGFLKFQLEIAHKSLLPGPAR